MVTVNDPVGCIPIQCAMGQTKNAESGLCECSYCGTSAECSQDADGDNLNRCTCNEGYEPDTTLTTGTHYYCKDQQCKNQLLHNYKIIIQLSLH